MLSMELQLGLALPIHDNEYIKGGLDLKRGFNEAFGDNSPTNSVLDLMTWHGQPNGDGDRKGLTPNNSCPINIDTKEENFIIGWPPIKTSRKRELLQHHQGRHRHVEIKRRSTAKIRVNATSSSSSSSSTATNKSIFVKVKMEGFVVARKVDLSLHRSYRTLKHALIAMFSNHNQEYYCNKDIERFSLAYQDKEGDWLLAGDVPWKSFIKSVQRLEIVRNK